MQRNDHLNWHKQQSCSFLLKGLLVIWAVGGGWHGISKGYAEVGSNVVLSPVGSVRGLSARVRQGKIDVQFKQQPGSEMPSVLAYGMIKAPIQKVWAIITDCARYHVTMPSVKESALISGSIASGKMRCKIVADLPWPMDDLTSVVDVKITVHPSGVHERTWKLVEGDYKRNEGSWTLTSLDAGASTLLQYQLYVEPNTSVPDFLKRQAQKIKIPGMFKAIRKHVGAED